MPDHRERSMSKTASKKKAPTQQLLAKIRLLPSSGVFDVLDYLIARRNCIKKVMVVMIHDNECPDVIASGCDLPQAIGLLELIKTGLIDVAKFDSVADVIYGRGTDPEDA